MAKNKIKGNINLPQAEETSLNTMFQGTDQTVRVPRERRTKHKDVSMTPSTFDAITVIAKAKGYSVNDYITLLIEEDIGKEKGNLEKYRQIYKVALAEKEKKAEENKANRKAKLLAELEKLNK